MTRAQHNELAAVLLETQGRHEAASLYRNGESELQDQKGNTMNRQKWEAARQRARDSLALACATPDQARELLRQAEIEEANASSDLHEIMMEIRVPASPGHMPIYHDGIDPEDHLRRDRETRNRLDVARATAARVGRLVTAANFAETEYEDRLAWWGDCPVTGGDAWAACRQWLKD